MSEQKLGPNQQKWYDRLIKGDLKQGKGTLQNENSEYCCLGVGCVVAEENGIKVDRGKILADSSDKGISGKDLSFQEDARHWLGLYDSSGCSIDRDRQSLWFLNDEEGYSFKQIAEQIKMNPEYYFYGEK